MFAKISSLWLGGTNRLRFSRPCFPFRNGLPRRSHHPLGAEFQQNRTFTLKCIYMSMVFWKLGLLSLFSYAYAVPESQRHHCFLPSPHAPFCVYNQEAAPVKKQPVIAAPEAYGSWDAFIVIFAHDQEDRRARHVGER